MTTIQPKDIILESALLSTMSRKQNFTVYANSVDHKRLLPATSLLLIDYKKYFDLFPEHEIIDFGQFQTQFTQNWHNKDLDLLDIEYYRDYVFPAISKMEAVDNDQCLLGLMHKQTAEELSEVATTKFDVTLLRDILDKYEQKQQLIIRTNDADVYTMENVDFNVLDKAEGIPYFLPSLQAGLGSLVKGQFVVVSADYGTGKTAFVLSQVVHAFRHIAKRQDSGPILYFNSEGTEADVFGRFLSNLYSKHVPGGFEEVVTRREEIRGRFLKNYSADKFMVFQISTGGLNYIRAKMQQYKPSLVVIDITDVLAPEEDVMNLKKVYDGLRLMSGAFCPIIGTTQSGDTSYYDKEKNEVKTRKWLGDKALYGSKSGKGGAADTIITIGKDDNNPKLRYISTPKKKRGTMTNIIAELEDQYSLYKEITF